MAKVNLPEGFTRWKPAKSDRQENGIPWGLNPDDMVEVVLFDGALSEAMEACCWEWGTSCSGAKMPRSNRICGYRKIG